MTCAISYGCWGKNLHASQLREYCRGSEETPFFSPTWDRSYDPSQLLIAPNVYTHSVVCVVPEKDTK